MDEPARNKIILVLVIGLIVLSIGTFASCTTAYRQKVNRDQEMVARLEIEEKMSKIAQEEQVRNANIKKLQMEMEEERVRHQKTKEALVHEQLVSQSLKEELQRTQTAGKSAPETPAQPQQPAAVPENQP